MPALVNNSVGSACGTSELEATIWWPLEAKNCRNLSRISALVIMIHPAVGLVRGAAILT